MKLDGDKLNAFKQRLIALTPMGTQLRSEISFKGENNLIVFFEHAKPRSGFIPIQRHPVKTNLELQQEFDRELAMISKAMSKEIFDLLPEGVDEMHVLTTLKLNATVISFDSKLVRNAAHPEVVVNDQSNSNLPKTRLS